MDIESNNFLIVKFASSDEYKVISKSWVRSKIGSQVIFSYPNDPTATILEKVRAQEQLSCCEPLNVAQYIVDTATFEQATDLIKGLAQSTSEDRARASPETGTCSKEVVDELVNTPSKSIVRVDKQSEYPNSTITVGNKQAEPNNIEHARTSTNSVENMEQVEPEDVAMDSNPQNATSQKSVGNEGSNSSAQRLTSDILEQMLAEFKQIREDNKNLAARIDQIETNISQPPKKKTLKVDESKTVVNITIPNKFGRNPYWTLKWKETDDGVVKLVPFCDIYVKEGVVDKLKESSENASEFAMGLVNEVFNQEALKICSVRKIDKLKPNWVLCSHALSIISDLVVHHAKENELDITKQICEKDITKKLSEFRIKYRRSNSMQRGKKTTQKKKLGKQKTKAKKVNTTKKLYKNPETKKKVKHQYDEGEDENEDEDIDMVEQEEYYYY